MLGSILYTIPGVVLRIENKIKPEIFDEKRGTAALLIKISGFISYVILMTGKTAPLVRLWFDLRLVHRH